MGSEYITIADPNKETNLPDMPLYLRREARTEDARNSA
jgi:hypothetical protein